MDIDRLIAGLPTRATGELSKMRARAASETRGKLNDPDLRRFIDAIDEEFLSRVSAPENGWTRGTQGDPRFLMHDGRRVGVVQRMDTHRASNGGVYVAEVLGQAIGKMFRHVDEARDAVATAYGEQKGR